MKIYIARYKVFILVLFAATWVLSGCQKQTQTIPAVLTLAPIKTTVSTTQPPTLTAPIPSTTPTPQPPTATWTPTPTKTPSPPTVTPIPTFSKETARAFTLQLINNNGTCQLPCWWGIIPGKTSWTEAKNFLSSFAIQIDTKLDGITNYHYVSLPVPGYINKDGKILQTYITDTNTIKFILARSYPNQGFELASLLKHYGLPAETRLFTIPEPREGLLPFTLVLIYPDNGFIALYPGKAQYNNGSIQICPHEINPRLWIWPSEPKMSFEDVVKIAGDTLTSEETKYYLPVENTISISLDDLYQIFKGESSSRCFETPSDKWTWPSF